MHSSMKETNSVSFCKLFKYPRKCSYTLHIFHFTKFAEISRNKKIRYLEDSGCEKKARVLYKPGREIGESLMDM